MDDPGKEAGGSWADSIPATIDALGNLIDKIWDKSPYLGHVAVLIILAIPLYGIYTWGNVRRSEKQIDERLKKAKRERDKRRKK